MKTPFRTFELSNPKYETASLRFVTVKSKNLKGRGDCTLFVPPGFKKITDQTPVVILLHGVYASHWAWTHNINVHGIALDLIAKKKIRPMILAMPSDGLAWDGTGYFDHGDRNFEKWIVEDVVALIRQSVPNDGRKLNLFIAGLSMGGYGALRLMAKYPDTFTAASGLSSITGLADLLPFLEPSERSYFRKKFGDERLITYLRKNKKKLPPFRFDCGADDALFKSNKKLHADLVSEKIKHDAIWFDGGHSNVYWNQHIAETLLYFDKILPSR